MHETNRGFTLIELSIVLTIIGLLAGGILVGQSLMRAAEIRSVINDFSAYQAAVRVFQTQYQALPGDMRNAVRFWGAAAGGTADGSDPTCAALTSASPSVGTATCNGNGDGRVAFNTYSTDYSEMNRFWQHLSNASMIPGKFTGVPGPVVVGNNDAVPGVNVPASKVVGAGFSAYYRGNVALGQYVWLYPGDYGNILVFGGHIPGYETVNPILMPAEAMEIDTKLDDGMPSTGHIMVRAAGTTGQGEEPHCATTINTSPANAAYEVTYDNKTCSLMMLDAF